MIEPGKHLDITYPCSTLVGAVTRLQRRSITIIAVRDLITEPLTPEEFLRRPLVRRSRWLITGFDEKRQQRRHFYLGNASEHESPGVLKVALWIPGQAGPAYPVCSPIAASRRHRIALARAVASWAQRDLKGLVLGIYCDDLRVVA